MELYSCESKEELELKEIELQLLSTNEILDLANDIKIKFDDCILEDERIVVNSLLEIAKELGNRLEDYEEDTDVLEEQRCRICGCTWNNACQGGCYWVEEDLCSRCRQEV